MLWKTLALVSNNFLFTSRVSRLYPALRWCSKWPLKELWRLCCLNSSCQCCELHVFILNGTSFKQINYLQRTKSLLHVKQLICPQNIISKVTDKENEPWRTVRLANVKKPQLQSVTVFFKFFPSVPPFVLAVLFIPSFTALSCYIYVSSSLVALNPLFEFG